MESDPSHTGPAAKKQAIDRLISEIMARDSGKGRINESAIVARHPELMPELRTALRNLSAMRAGQTASMVKTSIGAKGDDPAAQNAVAIEGYTIERELGWGGQAVVYLAVQKNTGRKVAIKVMRPEALSDERALARFQREVRVLAALDHPNIVGILDTGVTAGGHHFIVMSYVAGSTLDEYMQARLRSESPDAAGPAGPAGMLRMFLKICEAVNSAHVRGIVHRDLKPGNIRIDERGEPHVLDFGLAHTALDRLAGGEHPVAVTGEFLGSLPWCSPEQAEGDPDRIDIRSDVYSLGVILYQILTGGKFPYEVVGNIRDVLNNILNSEPTPPSKIARAADLEKLQPGHRRLGRMGPPAVNETIERIVLKALSKSREHRYQTAGELGHDVENYLAGQPTSVGPPPGKSPGRRWLWPAVAAALLVVAMGAAGFEIWMHRSQGMVTLSAPAAPAPIIPRIDAPPPRPATHPAPQGPERNIMLVQGSCHLDGDALVLTPGKTQCNAFLSAVDRSDYDMSFEAMTGGPSDGNGFRVLIHGFHGNGCHFWVGRAENTEIEISSKTGLAVQRLAWQSERIEPDRWYQVRVQVRGPQINGYLDGRLCLSAHDPQFTHGRAGLAVLEPGVKFRDIKITSPDGTPLWQGPPDLSTLPAGEIDPPGSAPAADMHKTDLLKTFAPATDAPTGQWSVGKAGLSGQGMSALARFRAALPAEYDYRITYVRSRGDGPIALVASANGHSFAWIMGGHAGTIMGFGQVDGADYDSRINITRHQMPAILADGVAHTVVLRVRKDIIRAYIDGQMQDTVNEALDTLSLPPFLASASGAQLGLWLGGNSVVVKSADLFELVKRPIALPIGPEK